MSKIGLFVCLFASMALITGCASTSKFQYVKETPWYEEINPANPQSDWMILDVTPDTFEHGQRQGTLSAIQEQTLFILE